MSSSTDRVPRIELRDDGQIPQLGFGVWQIPQDQTVEAVTQAFDVGYRHIDTASAYQNEAQVGQAFRASGLARDDVFVTTKLFNDMHGYEQAKTALRESLGRLELEYVDLYLIHWPVPSNDKYVDTWRALVDLQKDGLTRSIGVSNFQPAHLDRIVEATGVTPSVNQVELHPYLQQHGLIREHEERGIHTEAWSPLAQGNAIGDPALQAIADAHGKTTGQVVLRWHIQLGNVVFPKSTTPSRIAENFDIWDFHLTADEMETIRGLDRGERLGPDPDTFAAGAR